ncbi:hypothetical protein N9O88_01300 [bacterium]|nr:hypothetical protein [bacterium]
MTNFFSDAMDDLSSLENDILGPDYPYYKYVKAPNKMGMSSSGDAIASNIAGLINYSELLLSGGGKASATGKPLGNKFFMQTAAQCKDKDTGNMVTRSLYVNNVPDGSIPFVTGMTGESFSDFKGLLPGIVSDVSNLNPLAIFQAFMLGDNPECQQQTMEVINTDNVSSDETAYVLTSDLQNMNACWFKGGKNPVSGAKCSEAFTNKKDKSKFEGDALCQLYLGSLSLLGFYIFLKVYLKK